MEANKSLPSSQFIQLFHAGPHPLRAGTGWRVYATSATIGSASMTAIWFAAVTS